MEAKKRYLPDLTPEELEKVLEANSKIWEAVAEITTENAYFWIQEIMDEFKNSVASYHFDSLYAGKIHYSRYYNDIDFLDEFRKADNKFGVLDETERKTLDRLTDKAEFYHDACTGYEDISETRFDHLEKWFEAGIKTLKNALVRYCESEIDNATEDDNMQEQMIDCFADAHPEIYIIGDSFTAYEDVTKSYA